MKFYSEETGKLYDSEEDLKAAEREKIEAQNKEKERKEKLSAERKARADEIKDAYEEAVEASKLAQEKSKTVNELIDKFVRDYGSYHATFDKAPELYSSAWDLLFNRFFMF